MPDDKNSESYPSIGVPTSHPADQGARVAAPLGSKEVNADFEAWKPFLRTRGIGWALILSGIVVLCWVWGDAAGIAGLVSLALILLGVALVLSSKPAERQQRGMEDETVDLAAWKAALRTRGLGWGLLWCGIFMLTHCGPNPPGIAVLVSFAAILFGTVLVLSSKPPTEPRDAGPPSASLPNASREP